MTIGIGIKSFCLVLIVLSLGMLKNINSVIISCIWFDLIMSSFFLSNNDDAFLGNFLQKDT